jgi:dTDP-4-dehydrorhamnose reductase
MDAKPRFAVLLVGLDAIALSRLADVAARTTAMISHRSTELVFDGAIACGKKLSLIPIEAYAFEGLLMYRECITR